MGATWTRERGGRSSARAITQPGSTALYASREYLDAQDVVVVMTREHLATVRERLTNPGTDVLLWRQSDRSLRRNSMSPTRTTATTRSSMTACDVLRPAAPILLDRAASDSRVLRRRRRASSRLISVKTRLTELLGIEHPVMLAGMGGVSYSALAAAVSNAGGYGCLGASTMSSEQLAHEIAATRALTDKPFGVDLLTAFPDTLTANVELLIEGGASTFVAGLGVPTHVVELCHDHGVLVVSMCGKVEHARRALDAGCDVVVAQGTEAGGHTGTVATLPLVPLIVDARGRGHSGRRRWRNLRRTWTRRGAGARRRRRVGRHSVHRHSRGARPSGVSRAHARRTRGRHRHLSSLQWQDDARDPQRDDGTLRGRPLAPGRFPDQLVTSLREGTFHLGGDETTTGIDPRREGYPAGQVVGAISEIIRRRRHRHPDGRPTPRRFVSLVSGRE